MKSLVARLKNAELENFCDVKIVSRQYILLILLE